jgi:predicted ABC-type transport system involved in lysophospholipase L1 biosynthesis ATPase subunit
LLGAAVAGLSRLQPLHGLNIRVERGESVALVGANGADKTTFMRCVAGLTEEKRGAITFVGHDILRMPAEAIARRRRERPSIDHLSFASRSPSANLVAKQETAIPPNCANETGPRRAPHMPQELVSA